MKHPQVGTILHAYSNLWRGPRPAIVMMSWPGSRVANVNVLFDGANDTEHLAAVRASPHGNTFTSVTVYDPLTTDEREENLERQSHRQFGGQTLFMLVEAIPAFPVGQ